jgi:hypothetical protein
MQLAFFCLVAKQDSRAQGVRRLVQKNGIKYVGPSSWRNTGNNGGGTGG